MTSDKDDDDNMTGEVKMTRRKLDHHITTTRCPHFLSTQFYPIFFTTNGVEAYPISGLLWRHKKDEINCVLVDIPAATTEKKTICHPVLSTVLLDTSVHLKFSFKSVSSGLLFGQNATHRAAGISAM